MEKKKIAVVTGASSGMGRKFCEILDSHGFDEIWGLGLGKEAMEDVKKSLKTSFRYFDMDLTDHENLAIYKKALQGADPDVQWLVNCSKFGKFGRYDEIPIESSMNMVDLNCRALLFMTETTIPYMNKGGRIVQIASVAGFQPIPYIAVYGATKAFVISYSRALNVELKSKGISVTTVCPFWTKTAFFDRAKRINTKTSKEVVSKYVVMYDPEKVIKKAVKDAMKRKEMSIYGVVARSQVRLVKCIPTKWTMGIWMRQQKLKQKDEGK